MYNLYNETSIQASTLPLFAYADRVANMAASHPLTTLTERRLSRSYGVSYYNAKIIAEMQGYGAGGRYGEA